MSSSKAPSIFASGWTAEKQKILDSTQLPTKLRCKQCTKLKAVPQFSQRQLGIVKQSLARNPRLTEQGIAVIVCRQCTEGQVMELECTQCNLVISLEGFTKAQRRDPDFARCIACVNKDLKQPTANDETAELGEHKGDSEEEDAGSDANTNPYASDGDSSDVAPSRIPAKEGGSRWREYAKHHERDSLEQGSKKAAETYTGYDPSGKGHSMRRSPSTVASRPATVAPRSNFARIKAYKPDPPKSSDASKSEPQIYRGDGLMEVSETANAAMGRQREGHDSDSDSDFGCL